MLRAGTSLWMVGLAASAPLYAQAAPDLGHAMKDAGVGQNRSCRSDDPKAVVVCGRGTQPYRIDPVVLATTREVDAAPIKPPVGSDVPQATCSGPQCGGGTIPLVGMALTAIEAAELAAEGDDWRDAFRTRPDQYQLYQEKKSASKKAGVSFGVRAGSR